MTRKIRTSCFLRTFGWVLLASPLPTQAETVAEVTEKVRAALGIDAFESQSKAIKVVGQTEFLGMNGDFQFIFDSAGRFQRNYNVAVPNDTVFDGKTVRARDIGGEVTDQSLGDRANAIFNAWAINGLWFAKSREGDFKLDQKSSDDDTVVLTRDIDEGRTSARVYVSRKTWTPSKWEFQSATEVTTVELDGSKQVGPLVLPNRVTILSPHGGNNTLEMSNTELVSPPNWTKELTAFADSKQTTFTRGGKSRIETKRANTGHLLVHPLIDGKDLGWFIFDTGAGQNVIDNRAMKEAKLETFAGIPAVGVGGSTQASLCKSRELTLGPVNLHDVLLVGMDLAFLDTHMGEKIAGIIGYGLLARCIVEFDMLSGEIELHDPGQYALSNAEWTPMMLYGRHPCVPGKFEGHNAVFRLDTGASGTVTFHAPTVERLKLLDGRKDGPTTIGGVGGFKAARTGKIKWIELGGQRYKKVKADFATNSTGAFADPYIDANIGTELIGKSLLVLDYPHARIAFKKRPKDDAKEPTQAKSSH